jgi:replication factor C subunit 3/5
MTVGASTSSGKAWSSGTRDPNNQPWIEKYRPKTLDDVAANKNIIATIKRLTDENRLPHLLLYGPPGTTFRKSF